MKGTKRLEIKNELTDRILGFDYQTQTPGIRLRFLETRYKDLDLGGWVNYNVLLEIDKYNDTPKYLSHIFSSISKAVSEWDNNINLIDVVGIQEVDCGESEYYYVLLYILGDGVDKVTENDYNYEKE